MKKVTLALRIFGILTDLISILSYNGQPYIESQVSNRAFPHRLILLPIGCLTTCHACLVCKQSNIIFPPKMHLPVLSCVEKKKLRHPPWCKVTYLNDNQVLLSDETNFISFDHKQDRIHIEFAGLDSQTKSCITALHFSSDDHFAILVLKTGKILVIQLSTQTTVKTFNRLPSALLQAFPTSPSLSKQNNYKLENLFGIHNNIVHQQSRKDQQDLKCLDFNQGSLIASIKTNDVLICSNDYIWFSYQVPSIINGKEFSSVLHSVFYDQLSLCWTSFHVTDIHTLLFCQLTPQEIICCQMDVPKETPKIIKSTECGKYQVVIFTRYLFIAFNKVSSKIVELDIGEPIACRVTCHFVLILSSNGSMSLFTTTGHRCLLSIWPDLNPRNEIQAFSNDIIPGQASISHWKDAFLLSNGFELTVLRVPFQDHSMVNLLLAKLGVRSHKKSVQHLDHYSSLQLNFGLIFKDEIGREPNIKDECDIFFNILTMLMTNPNITRQRVKKYSRFILHGVIKRLTNHYDFEHALWWVKRSILVLSELPMSFKYVSFFVKLINRFTSIYAHKVKDLMELLTFVHFCTVNLERALSIGHRWFIPSFAKIRKAASSKSNKECLNKEALLATLSRKTHLITPSLHSSQHPKPSQLTAAHPMVAFYKGQYAKAVLKWQEKALLGTQPEKNLIRVSNLLLELECHHEWALFISWTFSNFNQQVFFDFIAMSVGMSLKSIGIKMLLLCGKFQEAAVLCHQLKLYKWNLFFKSLSKKESFALLSKEAMDAIQVPSLKIVQEIRYISSSIFPASKVIEEQLLAFLWKSLIRSANQESLLSLKNGFYNDLKWLCIYYQVIPKSLESKRFEDLFFCLVTLRNQLIQAYQDFEEAINDTETHFITARKLWTILVHFNKFPFVIWKKEREELLQSLLFQFDIKEEFASDANFQVHREPKFIEMLLSDKETLFYPQPPSAAQDCMKSSKCFLQKISKQCEKLNGFKKGLLRNVKVSDHHQHQSNPGKTLLMQNMPFWCDVLCKDFSKELDEIYSTSNENSFSKEDIATIFQGFQWCQKTENDSLIRNAFQLDLTFGEVLYSILKSQKTQDSHHIYESIKSIYDEVNKSQSESSLKSIESINVSSNQVNKSETSILKSDTESEKVLNTTLLNEKEPSIISMPVAKPRTVLFTTAKSSSEQELCCTNQPASTMSHQTEESIIINSVVSSQVTNEDIEGQKQISLQTSSSCNCPFEMQLQVNQEEISHQIQEEEKDCPPQPCKMFKLLGRNDIMEMTGKTRKKKRRKSLPILKLPPLLKLPSAKMVSKTYPEITYFRGSLIKNNEEEEPKTVHEYQAGKYDHLLNNDSSFGLDFASIQYSIRQELDKKNSCASLEKTKIEKIDANTMTTILNEIKIDAQTNTELETIIIQDIPKIILTPPDDEDVESEDEDYQTICLEQILPDKRKEIVIKIDITDDEESEYQSDEFEEEEEEEEPRQQEPIPTSNLSRFSSMIPFDSEVEESLKDQDVEDIIEDVEEMALSRLSLPFTSTYLTQNSKAVRPPVTKQRSFQHSGTTLVATLDAIEEVQSQENSASQAS